jgi:hypothetical protein
MVKNDDVKVTYYLRRKEHDHIATMARFLYDKKAIPRLTVGTYSRVAALKMFNELSILIAKEKEEADLKGPLKDSKEDISRGSLPSKSQQ